MKYLTLFMMIVAVQANAQGGDVMIPGAQSSLGIAVQTGYAYLHYTEEFINADNEPGRLRGNADAAPITASLELNIPFRDYTFFAALGFSFPTLLLEGTEYGSTERAGQEYLTQRETISHSYRPVRFFTGLKLMPSFQPFLLFEHSVFNTRRSDLHTGTELGTWEKQDDRPWDERIESDHVGAGLQGGFALPWEPLSFRYRVAALLPIYVRATNTHESIKPIRRGELGRGTTGFTTLSRIAFDYTLRENLSIQLGVNWYYRKWNGDGETAVTEANGTDFQTLTWPANEMHAVPVLLGVIYTLPIS